jgi:hypothetical protein
MTEQELRALVRETIAKVGRPAPAWRDDARDASDGWVPAAFLHQHASHAQFAVPSGTDACIIEPSVPCTHCGYCKSYGH